MDSDATSDDTEAEDRGEPGAIPGRLSRSAASVGAVRQAARPNRGFLWHRALPAPESDELRERGRAQVPPGLPKPAETAAPDATEPDATEPDPTEPAVPARNEKQVAPSVSPLDDDFDLDAALDELTSRNAEAVASRFEAWRRRSATGALLTGIALGLKQVFEPEPKEPSIVLETSGQPPRELPIEADLDQLLPRDTVIKVRPWLLTGATPTASQAPAERPVKTSPRLSLLAPVGALHLSPES